MGDFSKVIHPYLLKLSLCGTKNFLHWFNGPCVWRVMYLM